MDTSSLTPEQIQQMISMLQSMLPQDTSESAATTTTKNIDTKPKATNGRPNKFESMMEARLHKEDIEVDKKLSVNPPTPRLRKFQYINVTCRVCGKKESISPSLLTDSADRYKCNKCSASPG